MDKVQKTNNSECYTPSSEPFKICCTIYIERALSSGLWCHVVRWELTDISEEHLHLQASACYLLSCWFFVWLILQLWRWRQHLPPKRQLTFSRLHGVIPEDRTSNPTCNIHALYPCSAVVTTNHRNISSITLFLKLMLGYMYYRFTNKLCCMNTALLKWYRNKYMVHKK
jgi:hypothetical protein